MSPPPPLFEILGLNQSAVESVTALCAILQRSLLFIWININLTNKILAIT